MANPFTITRVRALEVLDSRGDPTVEVLVVTNGGEGRAIAPAGASRGRHEAVELRDGDPRRFLGRGVRRAVDNVNSFIAPALQGMDSRRQREIDRLMIELDGTPNKSRLGANAIIATSLAVAKAASDTAGLPLFQYLGGNTARILPIPMLNIINGGAHAGNELSVQEFMILPIGADRFGEALRIAVEVYKNLRAYLKERYGALAVNVGDEGGYAPPMKTTREALEALVEAVKRSGYAPGSDVVFALDAAASQFYDEEKRVYRIDGSELSEEKLMEYWLGVVDEFPVVSIEDPFHEEAFGAYAELLRRSRGRFMVVGDDLTVTNPSRLKKAVEEKAISGLIVKVNQVGTLSEALEVVELAKSSGVKTIVSHRSGESEDSTIAHIAVAIGGPFIKTGAPARGERTAKYNELLRIEDYLGDDAVYAARLVRLARS